MAIAGEEDREIHRARASKGRRLKKSNNKKKRVV